MQTTYSPIKKILLIDDDEDDCLVFKMVLAEIAPAIQLYYENCGDTIEETLSVTKPEIIFLDINLPRVDGLECLGRIQKNTVYRNIPVVIYSSSEFIKDLSTAYKDGATLYFRKPSNIASLTRSLKKILEMDWKNPAAIRLQYSSNENYQTI